MTIAKSNSLHVQLNLVVKICVIGDAFVDIICVMNNTEHEKRDQPVQILPGGSGLNTSSHLCLLITDIDSSYTAEIELQTVLNEHDSHVMSIEYR